MRFADIAGLALSALYQQKTRTALTMLGVVIGSVVLLLSLSIGQGVRAVIADQWRRNDQLRRINVWPGRPSAEQDIPAEKLEIKGDMSEARRERLRQIRVRRWPGQPKSDTDKRITPERLKELAALDHVVGVVPYVTWYGNGRAHFHGKAERSHVASADPADLHFGERVVAGSYFTADQPRSIMVSEYLLYQLGIQDEAEVPNVVGQKMRLEIMTHPYRSNSLLALLGGEWGPLKPAEEDVLGKVVDRLPTLVSRLDLSAEERSTIARLLKRPRQNPAASTKPVTLTEEFTISGVYRLPTREELRDPLAIAMRDDTDVLLPAMTAADLYFRMPGNLEFGLNSVVVRVDNEDNVKEVDHRIEAMGLHSYAPIWVLERVKLNVLMISLTTSFVALVALLVASLGIANTLLMSVLERTHEIGVMKAVGAREGHVQLLFLVEGALIGLGGSLLGLLSAWLLSYPLDNLARRVAEQHEHLHLTRAMFIFPWWLVLSVPAFVTVLTMLAAVYPARRAARVNPMTALRHE